MRLDWRARWRSHSLGLAASHGSLALNGGMVTDYRLEVRVTPRAGLLDPQGKAVEHALHALSFEGVENVSVGRLIRLAIRAADADEARERAEVMCQKLLANPVTEDYAIAVEEA
jgi:phosphoribosylformylglycinamidine synthase subunit PurS